MNGSRRAMLIATAGALLGAPVAALAQPGKVHRIGYLGSTSDSGYQARLVEAFRRGMRELGYVEGRNLLIEYRWAQGEYARLPQLASELRRLKVEVIVTHGTPGSRAAKEASGGIPVVMAISGDAVATGLIGSIARPGGNVTGSTFFFPELVAKRLELFKEALPSATRIAVLHNPDNISTRPALQAMQARASSLEVALQPMPVRRPDEFAGAFSAMAQGRFEGAVVIDDPMFIENSTRIAELAARHGMPAIGYSEYVEAGGLMAYAVSLPEFFHRAAVFVDKILKGAKPTELPVEQATRFDLIINLKAAKALGLTMPQPVLLRASQIIQ